MKRWSAFLGGVGIVLAGTIGAGMFSLPYVFERAGLVLSVLALIVMGTAIVAVHTLYFDALVARGREHRLLGFLKREGGYGLYAVGFVTIVGGLILALLGELVLAGGFMRLILPLSPGIATLLFWALATFPLFWKDRSILKIERLGAWCVLGIAIVIAATAPHVSLARWGISSGSSGLFLLFAPILFALAGWTAVEPVFVEIKEKRLAARVLRWGTILAGAVYLLFGFAVSGFGPASPDTVSGLGNVAHWKLILLGLMGIFALMGIYRLLAEETIHSLFKDGGVSRRGAFWLTILLPLGLYLWGVTSFSKIVSLSGGIFLSAQYLLIIFAGMRIVRPHGFRRVVLIGAAMLFLAGALYEIAHFPV